MVEDFMQKTLSAIIYRLRHWQQSNFKAITVGDNATKLYSKNTINTLIF